MAKTKKRRLPAHRVAQWLDRDARVARSALRPWVAYRGWRSAFKTSVGYTSQCRALQLLRAHLTRREYMSLHERGYILVRGGKSKRHYRIYLNGFIYRMCAKNRYPTLRLCVVLCPTFVEHERRGLGHVIHTSTEYPPPADHLLARKIAIQHAEQRVLATAVKWTY